MFIIALFMVVKRKKPPNCGCMDEWINELLYTNNKGIPSSYNEESVTVITTIKLEYNKLKEANYKGHILYNSFIRNIQNL